MNENTNLIVIIMFIITVIKHFALLPLRDLLIYPGNKNLGSIRKISTTICRFLRNNVSPPILSKTFQRSIVVPLLPRRNTSASSCKPKLSRSQSVSSGSGGALTRDSNHWENEISFLQPVEEFFPAVTSRNRKPFASNFLP